MKKYFQIFKLTFQEYFEYRLNFILWRFRSLVSFITLIVFWQAVYGSRTSIFGYTKPQMITYIIGIAVLRSVVIASRSIDLAGQIKSGELTKVIQKPWNIFSYWMAMDLADKLLNIGFATFEIIITIKIFNLHFYFPERLITYLYFFIFVFLSVLLFFFISFLISVLGFWTDDVWATRYLIGFIFLEFLSGAYFPIDILPKLMAKIIYFTPFPYLIYFPIKIWNEQIIGLEVLKTIGICFLWLAIFYCFSVKLWKKGVKNYGAYGG
jgi:ABC-2 type transport system permease protein